VGLKNGLMESWSNGVMVKTDRSSIPRLQHSNIPVRSGGYHARHNESSAYLRF
jgi:hypothetical protein